MQIKKKHIVITGGTSGIGYQLCQLLAADNTITVISRDQTKLEKLKAMLPCINTVTADLSKQYEVAGIIR